MSSKRENFFLISIVSPKKAKMVSDDDDDDDGENDIGQEELKIKDNPNDCITVTNLEEKSNNSRINIASQTTNEHAVHHDKGKQLASTSNYPGTIENTKDRTGKDHVFINTPKQTKMYNGKSVDKTLSFQNSSINSSDEESNPVVRADCSLLNDYSSTEMTFQNTKKGSNFVDGSISNILESNNVDENMFTLDPCHSKSMNMNTFNENPTHDQEQQMSPKTQGNELNCISLFTEDERDAISKLIIDSNLIGNEMENFLFAENAKGIEIQFNDFIENIINSDDESESGLDEKRNLNEKSDNSLLLQHNSVMHNAHVSEIQSDSINHILDANKEINDNDAQITNLSPLSINGFEYPIPDLADSSSSSGLDSPLDAANASANIDFDEVKNAISTSDLLEAELTTHESQNSSVETRIEKTQIARVKAPVINVLRLEVLTNNSNESSSDEQYKTQRTVHVIENEAHMIKLQKRLYTPNQQYFEGVERFNLIQGSIPDIIEVLKAYPDSTHHAQVRIFNPNKERNKNTVCNTYIKNSSKRKLGDCPICMYSYNNPVSTWCGHIFCENCLNHVIEYNRECPSCRKHLSVPYYHKVFL